MSHQGYGFCEFLTEQDADYACKIMNQIKLYGKPIRVNKVSQHPASYPLGSAPLLTWPLPSPQASSDRRQIDIGANLFVGNLDPLVDEHLLFTTFSSFGTLVQPAKLARDATTGQSKGYGFLSFDSFEASDAAVAAMEGQFLANKPVTVSYAMKKDATKGERHGTPAERLLAAQARKNHALPAPPPPGAMMGPPGGATGANAYGPRPPMQGGLYGGMPGMPGMPGMMQPPPPPPPGFGLPQQPNMFQQQQPLPQGYGAIPPPPPGFGVPQGGYQQPGGQILPPPPPPGGYQAYQQGPPGQPQYYQQQPPPPPPGFQ